MLKPKKGFVMAQLNIEKLTPLQWDGIMRAMDAYAEHYHECKVNELSKGAVSGSLRYSEREIDFAYLAGVFNVSGIDGLQKEIERLKGLGKNPHDIIIAAREQ